VWPVGHNRRWWGCFWCAGPIDSAALETHESSDECFDTLMGPTCLSSIRASKEYTLEAGSSLACLGQRNCSETKSWHVTILKLVSFETDGRHFEGKWSLCLQVPPMGFLAVASCLALAAVVSNALIEHWWLVWPWLLLLISQCLLRLHRCCFLWRLLCGWSEASNPCSVCNWFSSQ
jgi:hypothetical protein